MRPLYCLTLILWMLTHTLAGCSDDPQSAHADDMFESEEEREYAAFADRFAAALVSGDFDKARALGASHLKDSMTTEDMASYERKARAMFGEPVSARKAYAATTDREDLAGANYVGDGDDALDRAARKMSAERFLGGLPDSVPLSIRRASVTIETVRDPRTIPDFESPIDASEMTEEDLPVAFLTVVLVEEDGKLGVAHYWYRWPDIWD